MDLVLVVDAAALTRPAVVNAAVQSLAKRLDSTDRLAVIGVGLKVPVLAALGEASRAAGKVAGSANGLRVISQASGAQAASALLAAGRLLEQAATDQVRAPGARAIVFLTTGSGIGRSTQMSRAAHQLSLQGAVTSIVSVGGSSAADQWWPVANAGHGHHHRARSASTVDDAITAELHDLARVVARLIRVNVRLAPGVQAHRVIGAKVLGAQQVRRVKAREVATDQNLSRSMGLKADRGDDDDGIQTVIPYFLGGEQHVILIELWVEGPGPVAEVSLRYKDLTRLNNATARSAVSLDVVPRPLTLNELEVARSERAIAFSEALSGAAKQVLVGQDAQARATLQLPGLGRAEQELRGQLLGLVGRSHPRPAVAAAFELAGQRLRGARASTPRSSSTGSRPNQ